MLTLLTFAGGRHGDNPKMPTLRVLVDADFCVAFCCTPLTLECKECFISPISCRLSCSLLTEILSLFHFTHGKQREVSNLQDKWRFGPTASRGAGWGRRARFPRPPHPAHTARHAEKSPTSKHTKGKTSPAGAPGINGEAENPGNGLVKECRPQVTRKATDSLP